MRLIYTLAIVCYGIFLRIAALFSGKAKQWVEGRRGLFNRLSVALQEVDRNRQPIAWFHVSSLGEFEQGRPVIEAMREHIPGKLILLTFFSPSGYAVRKNYEGADFVFYLPEDTPGNARRFLDIVKPEMIFFVKYDFWFNFMHEIHRRSVPLYFISALFRPDQHFFKWYGGWFRRHLRYVNHFFVQDANSVKLLHQAGITGATLTGDTRFDRVAAIAAKPVDLPLVVGFLDGKSLLVAGSTWEPDEAVLLPLIRQNDLGLKFIIAPHDTSPGRINHIMEQLGGSAMLFSKLREDNACSADVLVVDSVGLLSTLYRYASIAFIGGGYGKGIHNIQEPVTYGVPVFFGPNYGKFREARDLVALGGAFCIHTSAELSETTRQIILNPGEHQRLTGICRRYVAENTGATEAIIQHLLQS